MAPPPTLAAALLITNFLFTYFLLTPRLYRLLLGISTNRAPRQDVQNYSSRFLDEGRITKRQLERLGRWEAAQQNGVENFPLLVASVMFVLVGRKDEGTVLGLGLGYLGTRIGYSIAYILTEGERWSYVRSVFWWVGNGVCFWGIAVGVRGIEYSV
jgi:uncharacterized MAPEG superfamily protein